MSVDNFIPTVWAARVEVPFRGALAFNQPGVCNRDYEGDIADAGDSVRIGMVGDPTIGSYTPNSDLTIEALDDASTTLLIDQSPYFAFQIDDVDDAQTKPKLSVPALSQAAYKLADTQDEYIAGLYAQAGSSVGSSGSPKTDLGTGGNAMKHLMAASTALSDAGVPHAGRWAVIPPWFHASLLLDSNLAGTGSADAEGRIQNGVIGRLAGFTLIESNNVSNDGTTWRILAGTDRAITVADQISKVEAGRMEKRFADYVKGLLLYGAKVVRPEALVTIYANKP